MADPDETEDELLIKKTFSELASKGVLARANYECCSSCAAHGLAQEVKDTPDKYTGIAYYHAQNDTYVRTTGSLCIGFATVGKGPIDTAALGEIITEALTEAGFEVDWDGTPGKCLQIHNLDFKDYEKCESCGERVGHCICCPVCGEPEHECICCSICGDPDCRCAYCDVCDELEEDCTCEGGGE